VSFCNHTAEQSPSSDITWEGNDLAKSTHVQNLTRLLIRQIWYYRELNAACITSFGDRRIYKVNKRIFCRTPRCCSTFPWQRTAYVIVQRSLIFASVRTLAADASTAASVLLCRRCPIMQSGNLAFVTTSRVYVWPGRAHVTSGYRVCGPYIYFRTEESQTVANKLYNRNVWIRYITLNRHEVELSIAVVEIHDTEASTVEQ
jgi:hypothetical protein